MSDKPGYGDVITERVPAGKNRGEWRNVISGTFHTQRDAEIAGRLVAVALHAEHFTRKLTGVFRKRNTYHKDPPRHKG